MANENPKIYTENITIRLSKDGKKRLVKRAKMMGLKQGVLGRIIIEHSLKGEPIRALESEKKILKRFGGGAKK